MTSLTPLGNYCLNPLGLWNKTLCKHGKTLITVQAAALQMCLSGTRRNEPMTPSTQVKCWETPDFAIGLGVGLFPSDLRKGLRACYWEVSGSHQLLTIGANSRMFSAEADGC